MQELIKRAQEDALEAMAQAKDDEAEANEQKSFEYTILEIRNWRRFYLTRHKNHAKNYIRVLVRIPPDVDYNQKFAWVIRCQLFSGMNLKYDFRISYKALEALQETQFREWEKKEEDGVTKYIYRNS